MSVGNVRLSHEFVRSSSVCLSCRVKKGKMDLLASKETKETRWETKRLLEMCTFWIVSFF